MREAKSKEEKIYLETINHREKFVFWAWFWCKLAASLKARWLMLRWMDGKYWLRLLHILFHTFSKQAVQF